MILRQGLKQEGRKTWGRGSTKDTLGWQNTLTKMIKSSRKVHLTRDEGSNTLTTTIPFHTYIKTSIPHGVVDTFMGPWMSRGRHVMTMMSVMICHHWNPMDKTWVGRYSSSHPSLTSINETGSQMSSSRETDGSSLAMNSRIRSSWPDKSCFLWKKDKKSVTSSEHLTTCFFIKESREWTRTFIEYMLAEVTGTVVKERES